MPGTIRVLARLIPGKAPGGAAGAAALTIEDAVPAARAREGDSPVFVELVGPHQGRVFRFVSRMTGSRDDAMGLRLRKTFMKAWQSMPRWHPEVRFGAWLLQIARNGALDALPRRVLVGFEPLKVDADSGLRTGPQQQLHTCPHYELLERALQTIAVEHREVLLLCEVEDLSYGEIAQTLGIAEGAVKSRIERRKLLR